MRERIKELLTRHTNLKFEIKDIEGELAHIVMSYEGSVKDALREGLVRFNFPTPPRLRRTLLADSTRKESK